jgi:hypothetical protein
MKSTVVCEDWKSLNRNTLRGFAVVRIQELHLIIRDVAVHEKNGRRWAQLPAKPQIKDGAIVKDATGRSQYFPIMEFSGREVQDAFSAAVINAIQARDPNAFSDQPAPQARPQPQVAEAEIPF